jgi:alkanesulfonate monooxygenase SsuD/methylene tetrahydromethanopterin reductase-like flavin-dependent oxidoreductase (luciferase family)
MRLGIYLDLRNPPPWLRSGVRVHAFALELAVEADRLGADSIWVAEHHLFEDGYLTQPLTFLAAVGARTRRVRLGTALLLAPIRRAVEIAEQASLVDLISNGRLDLGLGPGYRRAEFDLYGSAYHDRRLVTVDRVRELRRLWDSGGLTPAPVQNPIPIWLGFQGPRGARRAGIEATGLLTLDPALVGPYRAGLSDGGHSQALARMSGPISAFISDDPERDWPMVAKHLAYEQDSYRRYLVEGTDAASPSPIDPRRYRERGLGFRMGNFMLATPEEAASALHHALVDVPVDTVFFMVSIAGMPETFAHRHLVSLCRDLRPLLATHVSARAGPEQT